MIHTPARRCKRSGASCAKQALTCTKKACRAGLPPQNRCVTMKKTCRGSAFLKENKYDDSVFFEQYSHMPRSEQGLSAAGEWPALKALLPELAGKRVLDLGCGFGWHCRYAAEHGAAHRDIHNAASGAALVAFLDGVDGTKQNGADLVTVKVLGKAEDGLTGIGALELQKLACHGALEAGDARDAVAYLVDR